jgi:cytochrome P450
MVDAHTDERLTALELAVFCASLLIAGHETTSHLLTNGLLELMTARDQWQVLCDEPDLAGAAVEELLRYVAPVQWAGRVAEPGAEIGGVAIAAETTVFLLLASANRDENVFVRPDTLDLRRSAKKDHLSFGLGLHYCIGTPLARLEGEVVFRALAERFPKLELAVERESLEWSGSSQLRGPKSLPVVLQPRNGATPSTLGNG